MLFPNDVFAPEAVADDRARSVLLAAAQAGGPVRPADVLAAALRQPDPRVLITFSFALRPGASLQDLLRAAEDGRGPGTPGSADPLTRASFVPTLLRALDDFEAVCRSGGAPDGFGLESLLHFVLAHLDEDERRTLGAIDTRFAADLFRGQVAGALDAQIEDEGHGHDGAAGAEGPDPGADEGLLSLEPLPAEDLTLRARNAEAPEAPPFDGEPQYQRLFDELARALHRRQSRHVLLTGERGVGKASVVAELARRAAAGLIPSLAGCRFLSIDCRFIPPDESRARLAAVLARLAGRPDLVACLDGFAALLRGDRPAANRAALLAGLARSRCRIVGLVTPREFDEFFADDPDLAESFTRVEVEEPSPEAALKLLRHFARGLEHRFGLAIDDEAVRQAVVLSAGYVLNDQLPAKALKALHRACEDLDYERGRGRGGAAARVRVTADDAVRAVALASGVPEETLRGVAERSDYEQALREAVFGQDHAVREAATELGLIKAGMTDRGKPASVMLFLGQTGTGKTEMAKALARLYSTSKRLKTYTLGNCVEPHSVATIIGVPPGYVGHDQGGRLVNDLNADPYCVFLLDEADKAHPDVLQPFLNLFDEGWVCDQRGARAWGDKAIFVLTTNVGQRMIAEMAEQGQGLEQITARMKEALAQIRHSKADRPVFTPEFLSRLKRVIVFLPLGKEAMAGIARKQAAEVCRAWEARRGKRLEVPEALVGYVGEQAHLVNDRSKGKEGGRLVRKLLAEWVEAPLQRAVTERSGEYKECEAVVLEFTPPVGVSPEGAPAPGVEVRFRRRAG